MRAQDDFDYFYVVKPGDTLSGILRSSFDVDAASLTHQLSVVQTLNPHLKDINQIRPGMFLRLGVNSIACYRNPPNASDMRELETIYQSFAPSERELIATDSDILNYFGALLKYGDVATGQGGKYVGHLQTALPRPQLKISVQELRRMHIEQTVQEILRVRNSTISLTRQVRLKVTSQRLIKIVVDDSGFRAYSRKLGELGKLAKYLKAGGYLVKGIDFAIDANQIYQAWGTTTQNRTLAGVTAKTVGGAAAGGLATYFVCNLIFGLESMGTSFLFCGVVAGGTGAILGGSKAESLSNQMFDEFEKSNTQRVRLQK